MHNLRGKMGRHGRAHHFAAASSIALLLLALQTAIAQTGMPEPPPTRQDDFREGLSPLNAHHNTPFL